MIEGGDKLWIKLRRLARRELTLSSYELYTNNWLRYQHDSVPPYPLRLRDERSLSTENRALYNNHHSL